MTIAVGVLAGADVIVAADSQETYPYAKVDSDKIMTLTSERPESAGAIAVTGAGNGGYIDKCGQEFFRTFLDHTTSETLPATLDACLKRFYKTDVLPFGKDWIDQDGLAISTIVGLQRTGKRYLLASVLTTMRDAGDYVAVGTGESVARSVLRDLYRPGLSTESAARLAALAVYRAKDYDPYCGKRTEVVILADGRPLAVDKSVMREWEKQFDVMSTVYSIGARRMLGIPITQKEGTDDGFNQEFISGSWTPSNVIIESSTRWVQPESAEIGSPTPRAPKRARKRRISSRVTPTGANDA